MTQRARCSRQKRRAPPPRGTPEGNAWDAQQKLDGKDPEIDRVWFEHSYPNVLQRRDTVRCPLCEFAVSRKEYAPFRGKAYCRVCVDRLRMREIIQPPRGFR